jgi:hypothetical protein
MQQVAIEQKEAETEEFEEEGQKEANNTPNSSNQDLQSNEVVTVASGREVDGDGEDKFVFGLTPVER